MTALPQDRLRGRDPDDDEQMSAQSILGPYRGLVMNYPLPTGVTDRSQCDKWHLQ